MESGRHLHVYSTSLIPAVLSLCRPAAANRARNAHAKKYTARAIHPPFHPSLPPSTSWWQKPRDRIVCSIDCCCCSVCRISLTERESRPSGIFIRRRRVMRRSISLSIKSDDDIRVARDSENIIIFLDHDLFVQRGRLIVEIYGYIFYDNGMSIILGNRTIWICI